MNAQAHNSVYRCPTLIFLQDGWEQRWREGMRRVKPPRAVQAYTRRLSDHSWISGEADAGLNIAAQYLMRRPRRTFIH